MVTTLVGQESQVSPHSTKHRRQEDRNPIDAYAGSFPSGLALTREGIGRHVWPKVTSDNYTYEFGYYYNTKKTDMMLMGVGTF